MGRKRLEYLRRKGKKQGFLLFREAVEYSGLTPEVFERRLFEFGCAGSVTKVKFSESLQALRSSQVKLKGSVIPHIAKWKGEARFNGFVDQSKCVF